MILVELKINGAVFMKDKADEYNDPYLESESKKRKIDDFIKQVYKKNGLSDDEVVWSREIFGANSLTPPPRISLLSMFLEKFKDPTIILLCIAAFVSILIAITTRGHYHEGLGIIAAIVLATGIGFLSELKSSKEFELLNQVREERAKVLRNGKFQTIPIQELVIGDIVYLELGDRIPADGQILKSVNLMAEESLLTGESAPVRKKIELDNDDPHTGFLKTMVYRGTLVSDGTGEFIVTAVGDDTEMGAISSSLADQEEIKTPLQERLEKLAQQIGYVGFTMAILIFAALFARSYWIGNTITGWNIETFNEIITFFMVSVTIIVVAIPEGLPLMVNMSLALNMRKMAKANCLVKSLIASETIGSATVICSDKTGTLTQNKMKPVWFYINGEIYEHDKLKELVNTPEWQSLSSNSAVNSTANLEFKNGKHVPVGNATEGALLGLIHEFGVQYKDLREKAEIVTQVPFSSARKSMITITKDGKCYTAYRKGAPSVIIDQCSHILVKGREKPIEKYLDNVNKFLEEASECAHRIIAFSQKRMDEPCYTEEDCMNIEKNVLVGLVSIVDPIRPNVYESVEACHKAGIDVKMVTGDALNTAVAIARECKIMKYEDDIAVTHDTFAQMTDEELDSKIDNIKVVARSRPLDKLRLVKSLHARKETVGVTGDGTNDAPALRQADVGIAMGIAGTEVAKEAADIILLDDNFKSIVSGILWGRTIFHNIQRLIQFQLTVNVVALLVAFIGPFLGIDLPLTIIQLLWINIIMDTFAALALASEPPRDHTMKEKPRQREKHIITPTMAGFIAITGLYMTIIILILVRTNFLGGINLQQHLTIIFTTFVLFQFWNEFNCRALHFRESPFKGLTKNPMFIAVVAIIFIVQVIVVNYGGQVFRTVPLPVDIWIKMLLLGATIIPVGYIAKWIVYVYMVRKKKAERIAARQIPDFVVEQGVGTQ
jgi:P-type Ca2+ transporter type 2C